MGFDIECIIDIQTYPGEYFCPVCRTLVYPNEALQSQCTHLYCKPCLAHVANGDRACPYDGYLVTEADSKPLLQSDKSLAENIGKVVVRCLYHRSGCTWQGQLSECTSHCSTCSFGNSPVICNRCGVQIVHRQVHEHAQNCPGVNPAQQAPVASQDAAASSASAALNQNQPSVVSGVSTSQPQVSQSANATLVPGQDSNPQANAGSQAPAAVPTSVPTQEQWSQQQYQQYQQYYQQQYAGYAAYQQYYPYQQSTVQLQQQPQVIAQPQVQSYAQAPLQVPAQPQPQPQVPTQSQSQSQSQNHPQSQHVQSNSQPGQNPPVQAHPQVQPQVQLQTSGYIQHMVPPNLIQPHANPPKQAYPAMPAHAAAPSQSTLPHGFPAPHQYNQPQSHVMQPQQQQHAQAIQYQQYPQPQYQPQPHSQPHSQILPQSLLQNQSSSQLGNHASLNNPAQLHTSAHAVSGHQSYPQAQAPQNTQFQQQPFNVLPTSGPFSTGQISQQPALMVPSSHVSVSTQHMPFANQVQVPALPPSQQQQFHSQVPQMSIPAQHRPLVNSNQQLLPQQYVQQQPLPNPGQSQFPAHSHFNQQGLHPQPRPQVPPNLMQQSFHGYPQSQQNTAMAPNLRPQQNSTYGVRPMIKGASDHPQPVAQSSVEFGPASQIRPDHPGTYQQPMAQNTAINVVSDQHFPQYETSVMQQKHVDNVSYKTSTAKDSGFPPKGSEQSACALRNDSEGPKSFASEAGINNQLEPTGRNGDDTNQDEMLSKDGESEKGGANELVSERKVKEEPTSDSLENPLNGKPVEAYQKGAGSDTVADDVESQNNEKRILPKESGESLNSSTGPDKGTPTISSPSKNDLLGGNQTAPNGRPHLNEGRPEQHLQHYGPSTFQQQQSGPLIPHSGPPFGVPPGPLGQLRPDGLGILPQPRSNLNEPFPMNLLKQPHDTSFGAIPGPGSMSSHWRGPSHLGTPHAPPLSAVNQHDCIMGRVPQYPSEGQFGLSNSNNPAGQRLDHIDGDQPNIPGSLDKRPFGPPPGVESNAFRNNIGQGDNLSSLRSHDDRFQSGPTHSNAFSKGSTWPLDHGPRALERVHGFDFDMDSRFGPGGPPRNMLPPHGPSGFSLNDPRDREIPVGAPDNFRGRIDPNGPGGEYFGHTTHGFPPGSPRASRGRMGREEFDGRDMRTAGYLQRPEFDGPERQRFGEFVPGGPIPNFRRADFAGQDVPPGHFRGISPSHLRFGDPGFGPFPGHAREPLGPGKFHHNLHMGEPFGNKPGLPHFGDPGFRGSFSLEDRRKDGHYAADMDPFDNSRKRKLPSMGWCRICEVDCGTSEGLDMHSQTREHQKMAMDMVKAIKQQNKKKPRFSNARAVREEANKARNSGVDGRGGIML